MSSDKQEWPDRLLLNGSDYFQLLLDHHHRQYGLQGNISRFAVEVNGRLDAARLEQTVSNDPIFRWLHSLRLKKQILPFQLPQWKQIKATYSIPIGIYEINQDEHHIPIEFFETDIRPYVDPPFQLDLIYYQNNRTILLFTWNHVLMDSQGAEILMGYLGNSIGGMPIQLLAKKNTEPVISEQLKHAQKVRDFMFDDPETDISLLKKKHGNECVNHYHLLRFSEAETKQIIANCKFIGVQFGRSPLLLAASMHSFHDLMKRKGSVNSKIWVPMPQNQRKKGILGPLVGNQLSYLFYGLFPQHLESMQSAVDAIRHQMIGQMRVGIPGSFGIMMGLLRRLPLWLYSYLVKSPTKGALASFFFSDTGKTLDDFTSFGGLAVNDAVHYPPNCGHPGITIIFMNFQHRLQAIIAYTETIINKEDLSIFEASLRKNLFG